MMNRSGEVVPLFYDQHKSSLTDANGYPAVDFSEHPLLQDHVHERKFVAIDYDEPGRKVRSVTRLKIQLGLGCNYSCSYCLQAVQVKDAANSSTADAEEFVKNIDSWISDPEGMRKIELWGGEPLLYWHKIKVMVPALKEKFPNANFSMVTNGSLLTHEIIDQLRAWDFSMSISHDGPGHSIRGEDPFQNPGQFAAIEYAFNTMSPKIHINCVLTPASHDVSKIIDWFHDYLPGIRVGFEGVVHSYNNEPGSVFTIEQLQSFSENLMQQILNGSALRSGAILRKFNDTMSAIVNGRSSETLFQKCGMDTPEYLAVDLKGNVMTCQNVGALGRHKIGHVDDFDNIALNTSRHWSKRPECQSCPVLQSCQGSCMYQGGDGWTNSCNAEFHYNEAFLRAALFHLTGRICVGMSGNILRPKLKKDMAK